MRIHRHQISFQLLIQYLLLLQFCGGGSKSFLRSLQRNFQLCVDDLDPKSARSFCYGEICPRNLPTRNLVNSSRILLFLVAKRASRVFPRCAFAFWAFGLGSCTFFSPCPSSSASSSSPANSTYCQSVSQFIGLISRVIRTFIISNSRLISS